MKKDTPTYDELRTDAARNWQRVGSLRDRRYETMQDLIRRPWRCPTCGTGGLLDPVCVKCRSARIVEIE